MKKIFTLLSLLVATFTIAQNTCSEALTVTLGTYTVEVIDGTQDITNVCSGGNQANGSEWYKYVPTQNKTITVTTDLSQNTCRDTRIQVYQGSCDNLLCVDGNDDVLASGQFPCPQGNQNYLSKVTFDALVGNTYYIVFDNHWESNGFDFQITETEIVNPTPGFINFINQNISLNSTYRECVVDMNGDFLDDIVGVSQGNLSILYQNQAGGFTAQNVSVPNADFMPTWSTAAADFNKDGFTDLLYGGGQGVSFLRSNGNATTFTHLAQNQYVFSQRSNFVDLNNDGNLDAFVCHDVQPNVYYINNGSGNLTFFQGGMGDVVNGGNYGSVFTDYDNDGDMDLFIAKCRGGNTEAKYNELHRNNGNGTFTNVSVESNLRDPVQTWSAAVADYDLDGDMDILVGASSFSDGGHKLMRNNGNGTFTDITAGSGWDTNFATSIEHCTYDFNNDGYPDVLGGGNRIMYNNGGNMTFTSQSYTNLIPGPVGDFNNDGFLDIQNGNTLRINSGNSNKWIKIGFTGIQSNRNGIGARVEIIGSWGTQIREVRSGEGFAYMSSLNVHFGIGQASIIDQLIIRWPSGIVDTYTNVTPNQLKIVVEGATLSATSFDTSNFTISPNPAKDYVTITSKDNMQISEITIFDLSGKVVLQSKNTTQSIDVSLLNSGAYLLLIEDVNGNKTTKKFIKQ